MMYCSQEIPDEMTVKMPLLTCTYLCILCSLPSHLFLVAYYSLYCNG